MTGTIPKIWKHSIILPLHKKGPSTEIINYRPISLTCSLCKIMEKIIYENLLNFFEENNILPTDQHGFRKNKSVSTQLIETLDDWTEAIESKRYVDVIYFDISKAFDSVLHSKLLEKLYQVGIRGPILNWIKAFLSDRTFAVKVGKDLSKSFSILSGVPQGSVLGPLLFLFYISDLPTFCKTEQVKLKFFADDLKAYIIYDHHTDAFNLQAFINKLSAWCINNGLKLASEKCSVLLLGNRKFPAFKYQLNGTDLKITENYVRDLGININSSLKWSTHIDIIVKSAFARLFSLFKALKSINPKFLTRMYTVYVRPLVEFSSSVFNPYIKKDINRLESVQITACNLIYYRCFQKAYPEKPNYEEILKILGIFSLQKRRLITDLVLFHKILRNEVRISTKTAPTVKASRTRGSKFKIETSYSNSNVRYNFFLIKTARNYVRLPAICTDSINSNSFRKRLLKMDLSQLLK